MEKSMTDNLPHVYVIQGRGPRDFAACERVLDKLPAKLTNLPFIADPAQIIEAAADADALISASSPVTREVMTALDKLNVVVRPGVGFDVIDVPAATELGVIVVNIPDLWIREVANHAISLLLAINRKIVVLDQQIRNGVWTPSIPGPYTGAVHGETVGIVGLGNIGSAFARRITGFEVKLIACDPYVGDEHFAALGVERVSLQELAARADYISVHTLLNDETRHLIDDAVFEHTKPTAILINTSRGPVVDEQAVYRALRDKRLAGAALDVWESEPIAADNQLLNMDNVIATSHAAYFSSPAVAQVPGRCGEEVTRTLCGERPINVVNKEIFEPGAMRRGS
jgi:D-3-phosphoglycerate dehydrogenase